MGLTDEYYFERNSTPKDDDSSEMLVAVAAEAPKSGVTNMVIGDLIIICAQFLVAFQVVYEEKYIHRFKVSNIRTDFLFFPY